VGEKRLRTTVLNEWDFLLRAIATNTRWQRAVIVALIDLLHHPCVMFSDWSF